MVAICGCSWLCGLIVDFNNLLLKVNVLKKEESRGKTKKHMFRDRRGAGVIISNRYI